jgi:TrmH family RNA methyltransferase
VVVLEGAELLSVALTAGASVESVYVAPEGRAVPAVTEVVERAHTAGARVFDLAPGVIERIADTVTPQPVVSVVGFLPAKLEEVRSASMVLVCVDVRDPGNAGTVIRTADAAGVDAVICCDGTVDPTNPKTVRSSAGSLFHLPVVSGGSADAVIETLRSWGFTTVGTVVRDGIDYTTFDWSRPVALVFGNEASGLSGEVTGRLDVGVTIPMAGRAESLNVSVSAAVLCFEALRQRRVAGDGSRSTMPGMDRATGRLGTTPGGHPGEAPS